MPSQVVRDLVIVPRPAAKIHGKWVPHFTGAAHGHVAIHQVVLFPNQAAFPTRKSLSKFQL